jgi:hypothetical protein
MMKDMRCKICNLEKWNPTLYTQVHTQRAKGFSIQVIFSWLNTEIQHWNAANPKDQKHAISDTSIQNHFAKHVPVELQTAAKVAPVLQLVTNTQSPNSNKLEALASAASVLDADLSDFQKYHALVETVEKRFQEINEGIDTATETETRIAFLNAFRSLADLLGRLRKDAIQVRQQDNLLSKAIESAMLTYSQTSITEMLKAVDKLAGKDQELVAKMKEEIARILRDSAKVTIDAIKEQFKVA